jgi:IS5 family transposase
MSRRRIGQEAFAFGSSDAGRRCSLDDLRGLIDWAPIERRLASVSCSAKGEPAWPPLALFRTMLLAMWYDLSDVKLAEALDDRASFRRYCGFSANEATPERTAFVRFRKALIAQDLDRALFDEIAAQLKAKAIRVKTGTLVDATIIASASQDDDEARWVKRKGRPAVHGFKAHVGADADTALVEEIAITPANVNDGKAGPQALPGEPGEVFADSAYRGSAFREAVQARGGFHGSRRPRCGVGTRRRHWRALRPGTGRSTAFVAASRKSSEPGSEATVFAACVGEGSQMQVCKSDSPPSFTTSNAAPGFSRRPNCTAPTAARQQHTRQSAPKLVQTSPQWARRAKRDKTPIRAQVS